MSRRMDIWISTPRRPVRPRSVTAALATWIAMTVPSLVVGNAPASDSAERYAFTEPWRWSHFTTEHGLPSNRVIDVCEERDGTTWAATAAGLAWYDGYVWHAMGSATGVPKKLCRRITADSDSGILAVVAGKLYRGDRHGFRRVPIPTEDGEREIYAAAPSRHGGLLLLGRSIRTYEWTWSALKDGVLTELRNARGVDSVALGAR